MDVKVENEIKIIRMGEKGPNLLGVDRAKAVSYTHLTLPTNREV